MEPGWYQHYKGRIYYVFGIFINTETKEQMVAYTDMKNNWIRPMRVFVEYIEDKVPRFRKVLTHLKTVNSQINEL